MGARERDDSETAFGGNEPTLVDRGGELVAGDEVGEYRVERLLGRGGMGAVYLVIHPVIGKRAAVKLLHGGVDQRSVDRLVQEARAVTRIGHANIVDVFSFGRLADERPYIVMEYLDGDPLDVHLEGRRLEVAEALGIVDQVADALAAAHAQGIVHRDLKPANVFLARRPPGPRVVKLLDFGLAKLLLPDSSSQVKTAEGIIMGTPAYLAPEQAAARQITTRTDVYALGVMMFEMLVGCRPFYGSSSLEVAYKHLHQAPPRPADIGVELPAALEDLVTRMLAKEPGERPSLAEVRSVVHQQRAAAPAATVPPMARRRGVVRVAAVAAVVIAAAAVAAIVWSRRGGAPAASSPAPAAVVEPALAAPAAPTPVAPAPPAPDPLAIPSSTTPAATEAPSRPRPARANRQRATKRSRPRAVGAPSPSTATEPPASDDAPIDPLSGLRRDR